MPTRSTGLRFSLVPALVVVASAASAQLDCVQNEAGMLCDLQGLAISDEFNSESFAVSGDGSAVVGRGTASRRAWYLNDQFQVLFLAGPGSGAFDVSADGSVVVGEADSPSGVQAFRWTPHTGAVGLGDLDGPFFSSSAIGVSGDGSVAVGFGTSWGGTLDFAEAFRWVLTDPATGQGVMEGLGSLSGGDQTSIAQAVSADGSVVVGGSGSALAQGYDREAFRWTEVGGMQGLGDLAGGAFSSMAFGVSADGRVVVGQGTSGSGIEAFRWEDGLMTPLGDVAGGNFGSVALDVTADGSVVVGASAVRLVDAGFDFTHPFIWDEVNGMRDLLVVLNDLGLALPNLEPTVATSISDDGTVITGFGASGFRTPAGDPRTEAWIAVLAEPLPEPSGCASSAAVLLGLTLASRWRRRGLRRRLDHLS